MIAPSSHHSRSAAITGAAEGLGRDIALELAAKGYTVFGTAMSESTCAALTEQSNGHIILTVCDITDEQAVKSWTSSVSQALGDHGLDLLVSNAGILTPGPLEVVPLDAIRHEFEVNTFGPLSVINGFLPALRNARGRIMHISTWSARLPLPFNGPSGASKAAMDVFAMVYRAELKKFGIDVVLVPAGNMQTGGPAKTAAALAHVADGMSAAERALYGDEFATFTRVLNSMQGNGLDSLSAARAVVKAAEEDPPASLAPIGDDAVGILEAVRQKSDAEQDELRLALVGLSP
ncbi:MULTISPECIES: SDR family NAD(P)-dependent oxidoreductase [Sphingobium]|uniref:SDR family NAD(P)-dependent oxidoreductase n=1 Tax=Sphingobium TaxID=165695 RepID=UPI00159CAE11|nr:SDR family NAD(P)-dependent oxidoreductase [Sphingobium sp. 15-1]